jgi:hypothetical protein
MLAYRDLCSRHVRVVKLMGDGIACRVRQCRQCHLMHRIGDQPTASLQSKSGLMGIARGDSR